jgi:hypothetical protein
MNAHASQSTSTSISHTFLDFDQDFSDVGISFHVTVSISDVIK